jgi:hypothetical protein
MRHKALVSYLYTNPYSIERHFRPLFKEFSLGHGRIDIIGRDKDGVLCLVEVKAKDEERHQAKRQVRAYQKQLLKFLGLVGINLSIRVLVATPNHIIDVGTRESAPQTLVTIPMEVPTSREIYGLKKKE